MTEIRLVLDQPFIMLNFFHSLETLPDFPELFTHRAVLNTKAVSVSSSFFLFQLLK